MVADNLIHSIAGILKGSNIPGFKELATLFSNLEGIPTLHTMWMMSQAGIVSGTDVTKRGQQLFTIDDVNKMIAVGDSDGISLFQEEEHDNELMELRETALLGLADVISTTQEMGDLAEANPEDLSSLRKQVVAAMQHPSIIALQREWNSQLDEVCPATGGAWSRRLPTTLSRHAIAEELGFAIGTEWEDSTDPGEYDRLLLEAATTSSEFPLMADSAAKLLVYTEGPGASLIDAWRQKLFYHSSEHAVLFANVMERLSLLLPDEFGQAAVCASMFHDVGYATANPGGFGHEFSSLEAVLQVEGGWTRQQKLVATYVIAATKVTFFLTHPADVDARTAKHLLESEIKLFIEGPTKESVKALYGKTEHVQDDGTVVTYTAQDLVTLPPFLHQVVGIPVLGPDQWLEMLKFNTADMSEVKRLLDA